MAHVVDEYREACAEADRLDKLAGAFPATSPLAQGYKELAAAAAAHRDELEADMAKVAEPDIRKRVRDAIKEGLTPTIREGIGLVRELRAQTAPLPPIGMPTGARPAGVGASPLARKSPESMTLKEQAAHYRHLADTVQDRNLRAGYLEKAAQAEKGGV